MSSNHQITLHALDLYSAIQEVAATLPDDCFISLTMEKGSAYVEVTCGPNTWSITGADLTLGEQIREALKIAKSGVAH